MHWRTPIRVATPRAVRAPLLILLGFALLLVAPSAGAAGPPFRDPDGRVAFAVPDGWAAALGPPAGGVVVALVAPTALGAFVLSAESVPPDTTLDRYASDGAGGPERGLADAVALPTTAVSRTLGGEPARAAVFAASGDGSPLFLYRVVALHGGVAYTLTFATAPEEKDAYFGQARAITDTFSFLAATR